MPKWFSCPWHIVDLYCLVMCCPLCRQVPAQVNCVGASAFSGSQQAANFTPLFLCSNRNLLEAQHFKALSMCN